MRMHPHDILIQELFSSYSDQHEHVLSHLIDCIECQSRVKVILQDRPNPVVNRFLEWGYRQKKSVGYGDILDRISLQAGRLRAAVERERFDAPVLLSQLLEQPVERREFIVRNNHRFHIWGLFDLLLEKSREQSFQNADLGEAFAYLGLEIAKHLESHYGKERTEDLRARTWAIIGNTRRLRSDLKGAEEAFKVAAGHLKQGTGEATERAVFLDLQASLRRAQRRFDEALSLLRRAGGIFLRFGERHRAGRTLVKMSTVHRYAGSPDKAIPLLYEALDLIDSTREPRLVLVAWHNLIDDLAEVGQFMQAQKLLVRTRSLYQKFPEAWARHPRKWVEGRIARGLGQFGRAEDLLMTARDGFLAEGPGSAYDVALVSLDLASLYAEQSRAAELKRLAEEMVPIFSSRQIHREALAALAFWKQAVETEKAGLDLVTGVAAYLKRARHDPALRFQPV